MILIWLAPFISCSRTRRSISGTPSATALTPAASMWLAGVEGMRGSSWTMRKSPCPEVCEIIAPEGKMCGPSTMPWSIAVFRAKDGPPASRTVVKPRISVAPASRPAIRRAGSWVSAATWVAATSVACQWQSMSPGITARPPQSTTSASAGP
jgi:hypothetical protein